MNKRWVITPTDESIAQQLSEALRIHPIFCRLLAQRGVKTFSEAKTFFRPSVEQLHPPFLMKDMERVVDRLVLAQERGEGVLLVGDYDVDGTTSTALMYEYFRHRFKKLLYYIPQRLTEGYGLNVNAIDFARAEGLALVITLDCGVGADVELQYAFERGIEVIVCDHHLSETVLPCGFAMLNPKQPDCPYPTKSLSACAVAFKLVQAFALHQQEDEDEVWALLDLVALSIACDIVPITGETRVLAALGLLRLNREPRPGLRALVAVASQRSFPLQINDIVFALGPLINAAGRLGDAKQIVRLFLASDKRTAQDYAQVMKNLNDKRRTIEREVTFEAEQQIAGDRDFGLRKTVIVYQPHWHQGVIGIVAARLSDRYHRPALVMTANGEEMVGSGRSTSGINIHHALNSCSSWLTRFGGHEAAVGFSLPPAALSEFAQAFDQAVGLQLTVEAQVPIQRIDAEVGLAFVQERHFKLLQQFAPFGPENMRPIFLARAVVDTGYTKVLPNNHVRFSLTQEGLTRPIEGMGFDLGQRWQALPKGKPFDVCFLIEEAFERGQRSLRINVRGLRLSPTAEAPA